MSVYVLIPLLPLLASVVLAVSARRLEGRGHQIVVPAIAASFVLTLGAFVEVARSGPIDVPLYRFLQSGGFVVDLSLHIDQLTVLLLFLVAGVSTIVHVYSARYMIGDARGSRYFAVTSLFTFAMIMLVSSNNLLLTYVFWEVMGLCSYLLISHYAHRKAACRAATKAFLVNAVADVGLGLGVLLTFLSFGTLDIQRILASTADLSGQTLGLGSFLGLDWQVPTATVITLCLLVAAMGKSAQVPLHVWLPFAMEAPTPVSALIHAATMVNAGPFLLVRLSPLIVLAPEAMLAIAAVGATTALFAALVSLTQSDIKKILAYSTISQIGFMVLACGVGAFVAAIFHLLAHGFMKAFLFLSAGNALESARAHHEAPAAPETGSAWPLFAGALLLASIPPFVIFSGPYERLWLAQSFTAASVAFWIVGLGTVFFTAMYVFRGITALFGRGLAGGAPPEVRPRLFSPNHLLSIAFTLVVSVGLLVLVWTWFTGFLSPALAGAARPVDPALAAGPALRILVPLATALLGWSVAYGMYRRRELAFFGRAPWMRGLYVFFLNKGYFDEIYDVYVVRPTIRVAGWLWSTVDAGGIDRFVMGLGGRTLAFSRWLWRSLDIRVITRSAERLAARTDDTGHALQKLEPRTLQQHLLILIAWLVAAIGLFYWLV